MKILSLKMYAAVLFLALTQSQYSHANYVSDGKDFTMFLRASDNARLLEFQSTVVGLDSNSASLNCNVNSRFVALEGTDVQVDRWIAMILVAQTSGVPMRIFFTDGGGAGDVCRVGAIRNGFLGL